MINIKELKQSDVGRWVECLCHPNAKELGKIKSWNDTYIFVVYRCDARWQDYQEFTGQATSPKDLKFAESLPDEWKKEKCECGHQFESADDYIVVGEIKICWGCAENNQ